MAEKELRTTEDVFDENMRLAELERNRLKGIKNPTTKEKPFYVSQLPEDVQNKLKDMQKKKLLKEGYSEKEAEYYADEFLNEKIYTAEEFYGNNFWERPEFKEDPKSPGAEDEEEYYEDDGGRVFTWGELKKDIDDWVKKPDFEEQFANEDERKGYFNSDSTPNYRKIYKDFWDIGSNGAMSQISKDRAKELRDDIDTNDNGKIEVDEMADFQKSLDDYACKNKKGREDIPATYKR